jgi:hypothetical protein
LQLSKSRSPTGEDLLHGLGWKLKETGTKLANGRKVFNRNDAAVWLIEQLQERSSRRGTTGISGQRKLAAKRRAVGVPLHHPVRLLLTAL